MAQVSMVPREQAHETPTERRCPDCGTDSRDTRYASQRCWSCQARYARSFVRRMRGPERPGPSPFANLPGSVARTLRAAGLTSRDAVAQLPDHELRRIRNIGPATLARIRQAIPYQPDPAVARRAEPAVSVSPPPAITPHSDMDREIAALAQIARVLDGLLPVMQARVLAWAERRYVLDRPGEGA